MFLRMDIFHEILDDVVDGNIINIQFVAFNKKKEQVKRSFELRQLDLVRNRIHELWFKVHGPAEIRLQDLTNVSNQGGPDALKFIGQPDAKDLLDLRFWSSLCSI